MKSDVYFAPVDTVGVEARCAALDRLLERSEPFLIYKEGEIIPIKLTVGDPACVYNVSPELAGRVIAKIKLQKAKPFLFDTSVIYKGQRQNAVDHLKLAQDKGFCYSSVKAPFVIADGVLGQDGREFTIDAAHIKKIKAPSFVGMLDSLLVLSHATGHIFTGFAAAIKNVAMGMSCRPTKQVQHSSMKPSVSEEKCTGCGCCKFICPASAITLGRGSKAHVDLGICIGCGECLCACKFDAINVNWEEDAEVFCARMDEVARFILSKFKNKFFITFAFDITQECDCIATKDDRIISPPIGILASEDPLALDKATLDLMSDKYHYLEEHSAYQNMFTYAESIGLGSLDYRLIRV
ncbi:MAG: hypothetical protein AUJ74_04190 [Candidatus Omnitrophica bacterium CG1_02_44_16]|nr:MAG: hypothetical protein AUJ74_04190 [Candidatus Omnitrophica bacterium CG1_02_44_16]PIY83921.1 MAG: hypothetical protein COY78_00460 [Candidatus Omnitrophica bacterium CG_4_10_14_0_8_um_filter_44_12]PIZ85138.1 MAG: hypothetical protein COX96_00130 [Candidatus Omnitrophica bacterium CG_4_10_14_0_2_um_filter_44_9]